VRAREFAIDDLDVAAVRMHEFLHHRQPDARAAHQPALRRGALVKSLENTRPFVKR
jgi:hypothetical protein